MYSSMNKHDYIDDLVYRYQDGELSCLQDLLDAFQPFFRKYLAIVKGGRISLKDADTVAFLRYFSGNGIGSKDLLATADTIARLLSNYDEDEILNEMYVVFTDLALKYRYRRRSFTAFLKSSFRLNFRRRILQLLRDPLFFSADLAEFEDLAVEQDQDTIIDSISRFDGEKDAFGLDWINGFTCSDVFRSLSPLERRILVEYYLDHKTLTAIAEELGYKPVTVHKRLQVIKDKISVAMHTPQ